MLTPEPNSERKSVLEEQRLLADIGRTASASPDMDTVFSDFAALANQLVPFDRLAISNIDPEKGLIADGHVFGLQMDGKNLTGPYSLEESALPPAVYEDRQVVAQNSTDLEIQAKSDEVDDNSVRISAGLISAMFAPITLQGKLIGSLVFRSKKPDPYGDHEQELARQISAQIAGVISSNQQLTLLQQAYEERDRIAFEQGIISEIGKIVSSTLDFQDVLSRFATEAQKLVPHDRMVIAAWSEDGQSLVEQYVSGVHVKAPESTEVLRVPQDEIWHRLFEEKQPWVVTGDDYVAFKEFRELEKLRYASGLRAMLIVPLLWQGNNPGSIALRSKDPDAFGEHEVELAVAIAAQVSGAVAAANQYKQLIVESSERQRLSDVQSRIAEIGRIVSSTLDLHEVFSRFVEEASELVPFDRLVISLNDPSGLRATDVFVGGETVEGDGLGVSFAIAGGMKESVFHQNRVIAADESELLKIISKYPSESEKFYQGYRSLLIAPLMWQGDAIGTLIFRSRLPNPYQEREIDLAGQISAQIAGAVAISNQYILLQEEANERERLSDVQSRIAEIGRIISSTLDLDQVFKSFVEQAQELVPFHRLVISLIDDEHTTVTDAFIEGQQAKHDLNEIQHQLAGDIKETVVESNESLFLNYSDFPNAITKRVGEKINFAAGLRSILVVPFSWQGKVIGTLTFRSEQTDQYDRRSVQIAEQIGAQIAGAVAASNQYALLRDALSEVQTQAAALEAAEDAIIIRDADSTIVYVNAGFEQQSGFSKDEVLGTKFLYPEHSQYSEQEVDGVWDLLRRGESWRKTVPSIRKDGSEYMVDASLTPIFNDAGEFDKLLGIRRDVTASVKANEEIRIQAAALEAADDAIVIRNLDTTIEYVNKAFEQQTGYLESEVVGHNSKYLPTTKVSDPVYKKMWENVKAGNTWTAVVTGLHKDGSEYIVDTSLSPILNEAGEVEKFVGIRRDITARVKAEEANRTQAAALEAAADAVMIINPDTSLAWVNEAFVRNTGYSREEAIGQSSPFLRSDKNTEATFDGLWEQVRTGQTWVGRIWTTRKDGTDYLCDASLTPVFDDDGKIARFVGTRRDITELVQAEQDRETRRELDAQNQQLLELNKQREEFFSTVSHELRTPLTSVMAFADIISRDREGTLTSLQQEHLDVIKRNSKNLNVLVEDMLDFSRMSTDQLQLNKSEFEIHSLIDSVAESLEPTAHQRSQTLAVEPFNGPVWVQADHGRIVQVISNLITNSCKYSPPSTSISIGVSAQVNSISITVSDQGFGIPPNDLENIYSPFFRSEQIEVREEIGTGLGLAISKSLIDLHDGSMVAKSVLGKGTEITVTLPNASLKPTVNARP